MEQSKINRINELYKKSKTTGLTDEEKEEQKKLRTEYRMLVMGNLSDTLRNVKIQEKDGTIHDLKKKGH